MGEERMNEGLEALKKIKNDHEIILCGFSTCEYEYAEEFEIIEKELKEKEELVTALSIATCENGDLLKYKKVLEIIKKYPRNRNSLQSFRFMADYWEKNNIEVTKELLETYDFPFEVDEYDFLKEVLL